MKSDQIKLLVINSSDSKIKISVYFIKFFIIANFFILLYSYHIYSLDFFQYYFCDYSKLFINWDITVKKIFSL